ncbi:Rhomboid protease GluP [Defluviimonas aquaemixtae]|uniref:Rhomboid protease GluP n=1 Tax=Albidovulum aquaemixtae TaxID=1542388 RepID=A0A2R8BKX9_9RHOB|nr:rhomboid family intramembrane serine protease [Defluviimonas aquaemixtae]SPH24092.1 Rhomboid protease GluP [Defluviimonas aquaemixtae]
MRSLAPAWTIVLLCAVPELAFWGADLGLWGRPDWRATGIEYGGFWSGLLGNWRPNYAAQPWLMFATYGFLHAGLWHFALNMVTLLSLASPVLARFGAERFLLIYVASLIGGGVGFALLGPVSAPMVGASGALFGLAGAILAVDTDRRASLGLSIWPVLRVVLLLALLNLVLWWAMHGQLAWQTHLGGFLAGGALAFILPGRRRP